MNFVPPSLEPYWTGSQTILGHAASGVGLRLETPDQAENNLSLVSPVLYRLQS